MGTPFMSEIKIISWNFAPKGWALCNGQFLPINQNQALFSLLGTTYGGNGQTTFALPDLRGRVPIHVGNGHVLGEKGGEESHTLVVGELPAHVHAMQASSTAGNGAAPGGQLLAPGNSTQMYGPSSANLTSLQPSTIGNTGGSQAHENRQPFLVLNYIIALNGVFPSRN
jgi:microcystin-dependent protein